MCTVVVLRRPGHPWPLLMAANRDELPDRPWRAPGRHWPQQSDVTGGLDVTAGGSWLARNDAGVIAAVLNRINTLGPAAGRRSRGELPLRAASARSARAAAQVIGSIEPQAWRPFNMVLADAHEAFWVRATDGGEVGGPPPEVVVNELPAGVSMVTAHNLNDPRSPRIHRYLPRFRSAREPQPEQNDWREWIELLASRDTDPEAGPGGAMTVVTSSGFGTVSASLLAHPADGTAKPVWLFAPGRPGETVFAPVGDC